MEDEEDRNSTLQVLTLNCWGIPFISKDVKKRFSYIAKELATGKYDIVCLQEVWHETDYDHIRSVVSDVLPYTVYYYSGIIGSGVCVFSKYPIIDMFTYRFSLNGYMHMIHHGDWYGGKSVGYCVIDHPKRPLHLFVTHLHAEYNRQNDKYLEHRTVQAFQLSQFINHLTNPSDCVLVCGDMNSEPVDPCYRVIKELPCLIDTWQEQGQKDGIDGNTCDIHTNSYAPRDANNGKRIDYIFYRSPGTGFKCTDCQVTMCQIPGENISYSDHEGVAATFEIQSQDKSVLLSNDNKVISSQKDVLREVSSIIQDGLNSTLNITLTTYLTILTLALFIFLPCLYTLSLFNPVILHVTQIISAMFLAGFIFHSILLKMKEHRAYRNAKLEVDIQLRQLEKKKSA